MTWNKTDGDAPDIGFLRIPELDAKDLEAKGSVFYNLGLERSFAPSKPEHRMAQAAAVVGVVAEWTEEAPGPGPKARKATVGGLFGAVKKSREFKEGTTDLVEVEIDYATGPRVPKSYGGVSGGALWDLHVELDGQGTIVKVERNCAASHFVNPPITALSTAMARHHLTVL